VETGEGVQAAELVVATVVVEGAMVELWEVGMEVEMGLEMETVEDVEAAEEPEEPGEAMA
jgi:hypothetical protein